MKTILCDEKIVLELTFAEAKWLKERMQNCAERFPADEPKEDKKYRTSLLGYLPTLVDRSF